MHLVLILIISFNALFSEEDTVNTILHLLHKWPRDFNVKNSEAACGLFAPDLIASYPGSADRNYQEMCRSLKSAMADSNKDFIYKEPKIEQVLVHGDIAIVRLTWTLEISYKNQSAKETVLEKGLDVFKRQKDGSWKIAISYAYPLSD